MDKEKIEVVAPSGIYMDEWGELYSIVNKNGKVQVIDPSNGKTLYTGTKALVTESDIVQVFDKDKKVFELEVSDYSKFAQPIILRSIKDGTAYKEIIESGLAKIGDGFYKIAQTLQMQNTPLK